MFFKGHLALFPNPLYPQVHHGNPALLSCPSPAPSVALRGTAWSFSGLAGAVNESCAWQTGCSKQNAQGNGTRQGTHRPGELQVVVPAGREQQRLQQEGWKSPRAAPASWGELCRNTRDTFSVGAPALLPARLERSLKSGQ